MEEPPPRRPAYFWWLLANGLAICFAVFSWVICLHVFRHPENPRNYEILRKLKRLPELKRYSLLEAPSAISLGPKELYRKFFGLDEARRTRLNEALLRNYLINFERPLLLTYVEGNYRVEDVRPLGEKDFFEPGFAVRGRAMVKPDEFTEAAPYPVVIEYLFPTVDRAAFSWFKPVDTLSVSKVPNCASVLNVSKVTIDGEQVLCVTVVPIVYGEYQVGPERSFAIEPPDYFKPGATFPLFK
jgi:hypothetical protein